MKRGPFSNSAHFYLIFILALLSKTSSQNTSTQVLPCEPTSNKFLKIKPFFTLNYHSFSNFNQLQLLCDIQTYQASAEQDLSVPSISFDFSVIKILNESIDLSSITNVLWEGDFLIRRLQGIDIETQGPIFKVDPNADWVDSFGLYLIESKFDFYYRGTKIDEENCQRVFFDSLNVRLFSNLGNLIIRLEENVLYENPVCPFVFDNANINGILAMNLLSEVLSYHVLSYINRSPENSSSSVNQLDFGKLYNVNINEHLVSKYVYKHLTSFKITGRPGIIHPYLFKSFRNLNNMNLQLERAYDFYHLSSNEWMSSLLYDGKEFNSAVEKVDYISANRHFLTFLMTMNDLSNDYTYPDEDFCLFRHFPFRKLISVVIQYSNQFYRSCTLTFLFQNSFILRNTINYTKLNQNQAQLESCNISQYMSRCVNFSKLKLSWSLQSKSNLDMIYIFKWTEFIGPVMSFPVFAALGFFLNLITILVIKSPKNKKEKLFERKIFDFIVINSTFNCIECLIYQLKLMNICLGAGSVYCSSVMTSEFAQNVAVYVTGYLSETMKTCSILTGLLFSIQRCEDTSKVKNKFFVKITSMGLIKQSVLIVTFSGLTSMIKIFNYDIETQNFGSFDSPISFQINSQIQNQYWYMPAFYFFHYCLNDLVLLLVNLIIDIRLVFVIKRNMAEKIEFKTHSCEKGEKICEKFKRDIKHHQDVNSKLNSMIIATLLIYIFCRLPEFFASIYFFDTKLMYLNNCMDNYFCYLLYNAIEYLYMVSYSSNILLYYKFNSQFQSGFRNFFNMKSKHVQRKI